MATYVVWEAEYPEEGSTEVEAESVEEAKQAYRDLTGSDEDVELEADLLTPELERVREAESEDDLRRVISLYGKALKVAREKGEHYPVCSYSKLKGRPCNCWKAEMEAVFR